MLKQLKLVHAIGSVVTGFWLAFMALALTAWWGLSTSAESLRVIHDERMVRAGRLNSMQVNMADNRMEIMRMFQHDPQGPLKSAHDHPLSVHFEAYAKRREETSAAWKALRAGVSDPAELQLIDRVDATRTAWVVHANKALDALRANDFNVPVMAGYLKAIREEGTVAETALQALQTYQQTAAAEATTAAQRRHQWAISIFVALVLLLGLPCSVISLALMKRVRSGLAQADAAAQAISEGDLSHTVRSEGQDEIATLLQRLEQMRQQLARVISQVRSSSDSIEVASTEVAAGNTDLSHRTEQTASNLQQTASSTEELGATVRQNADNARQANQLAAGASEIARKGGAAVSQVVETMRGINESSRRIADIIGVIDGIAFQTNILALNAAVEAARAGEQGRGFAVVAGEVRSLAQRSAEAAREIKGLIVTSVERVEQGSRQADEAGATMNDVVRSISSLTDLVGEISTASSEQSEGVTQVGRAVSQMDEATQQNAALVEQSAAAAESLRSQAQQLVQAVSSFKINH